MTIVFPDLHQPTQRLLDQIEQIIATHRADEVVFLGDYFDSFGDSTEDARRTAHWLRHSLSQPNRVHLVGNHDLAYLWPCNATHCPGWSPDKQRVIATELGFAERDATAGFRFHAWSEGWLLSHAGLGADWVPPGADVRRWLDGEEQDARLRYAVRMPHWFNTAGYARGGRSRSGGILWCDWSEQRWDGLQLFGHTPAHDVRRSGRSVCLDTNIGGGPRHYAILNEAGIEVRELGITTRER